MKYGFRAGAILFCMCWFFTSLDQAAGEDKRAERPRLPNPFSEPPKDNENKATNLGIEINSSNSDFGPIISPDGNHLYFTSSRPGGKGGQDVWISKRENGEWQPAQNLGPPINTAGDEGPDSFSLSENALYFTACDREYGEGGCDLYVSFKLKSGKWSIPENIGPPVNTKHNESNASISSDGDFIIFTSDRPDGLGGTDLWIANRGQMIKKLRPGFSTAGRWEEPKNLGPGINTPDWEGVGFLMPDNQTLYLSSRGRGGSGLADIFRSVLRDGKWGRAENMGDIVNTTRDDIYFTLPGSGDLAYFSSDMAGGHGMEDIYSIPIPLLIPKTRMVVLRGKVEDAKTGAPLQAMVKIIDPVSSEVLAQVESGQNGAFQLVVQVERLQIEVVCDTHECYKETVEVDPNEAMAMVNRDIKLSPK